MDDQYICERCGWEIGFFPEDYDYIEENYPTVCPLCMIPIVDMIIDIFKAEGIKGIPEIFRRILLRIKYHD